MRTLLFLSPLILLIGCQNPKVETSSIREKNLDSIKILSKPFIDTLEKGMIYGYDCQAYGDPSKSGFLTFSKLYNIGDLVTGSFTQDVSVVVIKSKPVKVHVSD